jgi:hypothetical protein
MSVAFQHWVTAPSRITSQHVGLEIGAPGRTRTSTPFGQQILSLPRLPIPPQGQADKLLAVRGGKINKQAYCLPAQFPALMPQTAKSGMDGAREHV